MIVGSHPRRATDAPRLSSEAERNGCGAGERILGAILLVAVASFGPGAQAHELALASPAGPGSPGLARLSERTVSVAVSVDRDSAHIVAFTLKNRPFERAPGLPAARAYGSAGAVQIEVALIGPKEKRHTQRLEINGLCLDHPAGTPGHVEGDTIRLHREVLIVEVPELEGFDTIAVGYYAEKGGEGVARVPLGTLNLAPERFTPAGGTDRYADLTFASRDADRDPKTASLTPGTVHWPEAYGDSDIYTIYGDPAETSRRINIVIVPDGYTYAQKALMQSHAQSLVNFFRGKTPFAEHDRFLNYTLVYAYSTESGTDECDCSVVRDTAMNTRFPLQTATCGSSDNRCLYYGTGNGGPSCDPNTSTTNIAAAELRAPAIDTTLIMVNTARYGGCGGYRAVYSAGNSSATEVAIHELGHSLAGLADEYSYTTGCGSFAGEINTSTRAAGGAWSEWIADIGPPHQGAQYYTQCIYRPSANCDMRALGVPFCAVCNQRWALTFFGWYRVAPTAPIESSSPAPSVVMTAGVPTNFSVTTRFATGVTNQITWRIEGPGFPGPTVVASNTVAHTGSFTTPGDYLLACEVIADTNFVKPEKYGSNRKYATWSIQVAPVPEVSDDAIHRITVERNGPGVDIRFEDVGAAAYNLYVSNTPATSPFLVSDAGTGKRDCAVSGVTSAGGGMKQLVAYDLAAGLTGNTDALFFLITADNGSATEGSLGKTSAAIERAADAYCNRPAP